MFTQSLLYSTEKVYNVYEGQIFDYQDAPPKPIFICKLVAMHTFMMQHALFVG